MSQKTQEQKQQKKQQQRAKLTKQQVIQLADAVSKNITQKNGGMQPNAQQVRQKYHSQVSRAFTEAGRIPLPKLEAAVAMQAMKAAGLTDFYNLRTAKGRRDAAYDILGDDFSWGTLAGLATTYGPKIFDWVVDQFHQHSGRTQEQQVRSMRSQLRDIAPNPTSLYGNSQYKVQSTGPPVPHPNLTSGYGFDDVNIPVLETFIMPGQFAERRTDVGSSTRQTAIASFTTTYTMTSSTATGACEMFVYPQFPTVTASLTVGSEQYFSIVRNSDFNASAGVGTVTNINNGPLQPNAAQIMGYRMSGFQITVYATSSVLNLQGTIAIAYFQQPPNSSFYATAPGTLSLQELSVSAFFQNGNANTTFYARRIPKESDVYNTVIPPTNPQDEFFVIRFYGGSLTTPVTINVVVSAVYDIVPVSTMLTLIRVQMPNPGSATEACYSNIIKRWPAIQYLDNKKAMEAIMLIRDTKTCSHDQLLRMLNDKFAKYVHYDQGEILYGQSDAGVVPMGDKVIDSRNGIHEIEF